MIFDRLRRAFRSIHTRLLLVILVSGLGILLLFRVATLAHRTILANAFRLRLANYVQYVVKDLGSPPDYNRAVKVAAQTDMIIYYLSPEVRWATPGPVQWPTVSSRFKFQITPSIWVERFRRHRYLVYVVDANHRFLFEMLKDPSSDKRLVQVNLVFLFSLIVLLVGSFVWIRRILAPLLPLSRGVRELGAGSLSHRVSIDRADELGELASAFNSMADRLQHLIGAKDRLLLDVSHELRSPLTRMRLALEMSPDGALKESLSEDIGEMERMVTTILANARMQSGSETLERQTVDLVLLLREAVEPLKSQAPGVCFREAQESIEAFLDPEKTKAVFRNVVGNAIKYSRETSGPVVISVRAGPESNTVEIRDEGIGIPEQDLPFVFEPFYRVDPSRSKESGGFGLGLSLCKAIMEAHQGSISIESSAGKGTTVLLQFPRK